jgi:Raf kinase inhibitor-like YbhB/YbcL family protein
MVTKVVPDKPMRHCFAPILLLAAAAGCSARTDKALAQFSLTSSGFQNEAAIPAQFTCGGAGQSPPLAWGGPPQGTRSFALVVEDPDAPRGTFRHWAAYDIPANLRSFDAGAGNSAVSAFAQALNDFGKPGYGPPCPPPGHGRHHYTFKLLALDVDKLGVSANASAADVEKEANQHAIGRAQLTGVYERR